MKIASRDRLEQQRAEARPTHERLHDERHAEEARDRQSHEREQRVRGSPQRVAKEQPAMRNAARAGSLDERRGEHIDQTRAHVSDQHRQHQQDEGGRRQDHVNDQIVKPVPRPQFGKPERRHPPDWEIACPDRKQQKRQRQQ